VKKQKEDVPLKYYERSYALLGTCLALTAIFGYWAYTLIRDVSAWGFIVGIPTVVLGYQTLWLILNPFAIIYEDKFEVKRSVIHNKIWHYIDLKNVSEPNAKGFDVTYNDDDKENVSTAGIRPSHRQEFRNTVNHYVCKSLVERED
jgi:hypothetical protein